MKLMELFAVKIQNQASLHRRGDAESTASDLPSWQLQQLYTVMVHDQGWNSCSHCIYVWSNVNIGFNCFLQDI